ncbi:GPI mannosyltransferase 2, partial [Elsinoe ampelina]
ILSLFSLWKIALLLVVALSPGPGYDTSSELLLWDDTETPQARELVSHVLHRLLRWDAIYFVNIANRGYLYEQEWAFGRGFMLLTGQLSKVIPESFLSSDLLQQALSGAVIAHLAHGLTVVLLYELTFRALPGTTTNRRQIARVAACLHVVSPAGVFLSAPYTESLFACLNFSGLLCLAGSPKNPQNFNGRFHHLTCYATAGICFALATTVRSNGLLSVLAIVVLTLPAAFRILTGKGGWADLFTLVSAGIGALLATSGIIVPQYWAYNEYCTGVDTRPWCSQMPPSIISFVQRHYWGNGFLAYWTLSNLPLFLIAAPVLLLLFWTAGAVLLGQTPFRSEGAHGKGEVLESGPQTETLTLQALAAPQLLLSLLALTTFHVQIINRISSGYPIWYIILATCIVRTGHGRRRAEAKAKSTGQGEILPSEKTQRYLVKGAVLYAFIQAGLYSSFLPPA